MRKTSMGQAHYGSWCSMPSLHPRVRVFRLGPVQVSVYRIFKGILLLFDIFYGFSEIRFFET